MLGVKKPELSKNKTVWATLRSMPPRSAKCGKLGASVRLIIIENGVRVELCDRDFASKEVSFCLATWSVVGFAVVTTIYIFVWDLTYWYLVYWSESIDAQYFSVGT